MTKRILFNALLSFDAVLIVWVVLKACEVVR